MVLKIVKKIGFNKVRPKYIATKNIKSLNLEIRNSTISNETYLRYIEYDHDAHSFLVIR